MVQKIMASLHESPGHETAIATRLTRAILAKAFAEIAIVCLAVTLAAFAYFNPTLRGEIEVVDGTQISGWVHDPCAPDEWLDVQLFIDQRFAAAGHADVRRDGNPGFAFSFATPSLRPGRHRVEVLAVRKTKGTPIRTLLPIGKGKRFLEIKE